jgi:hypothetical protein
MNTTNTNARLENFRAEFRDWAQIEAELLGVSIDEVLESSALRMKKIEQYLSWVPQPLSVEDEKRLAAIEAPYRAEIARISKEMRAAITAAGIGDQENPHTAGERLLEQFGAQRARAGVKSRSGRGRPAKSAGAVETVEIVEETETVEVDTFGE